MKMSSSTYLSCFSVKCLLHKLYFVSLFFGKQYYIKFFFLTMNQIGLVWSFVVHIETCVLQPCPSSKMATVAKKKIQSLIDDYSFIFQVKMSSNGNCYYMKINCIRVLLCEIFLSAKYPSANQTFIGNKIKLESSTQIKMDWNDAWKFHLK